MKLIVIDDYMLEGKMIEKILQDNRPDIQYCGQALSASEGLNLARTVKPDLALVDIKMPDMDGLTLIPLLKKALPSLKILLISAYGEFAFAQKALLLGANGYILKPTSQKDLFNAISHIEDLTEEENRKKTIAYEENAVPSNLINIIFNDDENACKEYIPSFLSEYIDRSCDLSVIIEKMQNFALNLTKEIRIAYEKLGRYQPEVITIAYTTFIQDLDTCSDLDGLKESIQKLFLNLMQTINIHSNNPNYSQLKKAKSYIDNHLQDNLTLDIISQLIYMDRYSLSRSFQSYTGMHFSKYVMLRRIEKAKLLLATTGDSIEQISESVGYLESNSFRRVFKKHVGMSPKQYRIKNSQTSDHIHGIDNSNNR